MTGSRIGLPLTLTSAALALACSGAPAPEAATLSRVGAGIAFFEARVRRDTLDGVAAARLVGRYVTRFHLSADLADLARAEWAARRVLSHGGDPGGAWARLSGIELMQHKFAAAAASADSALAAAPTSADAIGAAFDAALATGRYQQAGALLRRLPPLQTGSLVRQAQWHDALGRTEAGFSAMERVCRALERSLAPSTARAWCLTELAALAARRRGDGAARVLYRRALRVEPGYRGAVEGLANLDAAAGNHRRALARYRVLATDAHPDLYLRMAELAGQLGDSAVARAAEARFRAAALLPEREALFGPDVVRYWLGRGHPDSALAVARREVARRPTVESHVLMAEAARAAERR